MDIEKSIQFLLDEQARVEAQHGAALAKVDERLDRLAAAQAETATMVRQTDAMVRQTDAMVRQTDATVRQLAGAVGALAEHGKMIDNSLLALREMLLKQGIDTDRRIAELTSAIGEYIRKSNSEN